MRLTPELQLRIDCGVFRVLQNETSVTKDCQERERVPGPGSLCDTRHLVLGNPDPKVGPPGPLVI
jgi:hypothetical protein